MIDVQLEEYRSCKAILSKSMNLVNPRNRNEWKHGAGRKKDWKLIWKDGQQSHHSELEPLAPTLKKLRSVSHANED